MIKLHNINYLIRKTVYRASLVTMFYFAKNIAEFDGLMLMVGLVLFMNSNRRFSL